MTSLSSFYTIGMRRCLLSFILSGFIFVAFCTNLQAQQTTSSPKSEFWKKVRFGGGLGLSFGNNNTQINISPSALYQPNPYVAFGYVLTNL